MPETLRPLILKATMSYIKGEPDIEHFEKIVGAMLRRDVELALEYLYEDIRNI